MIALAVTLVVFPMVGYATAVLLRIPVPSTIAARVAFLFLLGVGAHGAVLFALSTIGVPLNVWTFAAVPVLSLFAVRRQRLRFRTFESQSGGVASALQGIPLVILFVVAAVLPTRDYDGRVTWLPKARAIALEASTTGPFFHGERGLNLHNRYPLLLPLDAATVMRLSSDTRNEAARWLYVLIPIALFVALRAMLPSPWIAAALPWLGVVTMIEGGALAAYNDYAMAAFFGLALLSLEEDSRTAGVFAGFAILTKNEGLALAVAIVGAAVLARKFRWSMLVPVAVAEAIVVGWRVQVPAAYDEQYEVLVSSLPEKLERVPHALGAFAKHAMQFSEWGLFWIAVGIAAIVVRRRGVVPLVAMTLALVAYVVALAVTSWSIDDLAPVAVNRLLLHLLVPGAWLVAAALARRNTEPPAGVTPGP